VGNSQLSVWRKIAASCFSPACVNARRHWMCLQCKQIAEIDERKAVRFHIRQCKLQTFRSWLSVVATEKQTAQHNDILAGQHNTLWVAQRSRGKTAVWRAFFLFLSGFSLKNRFVSRASYCVWKAVILTTVFPRSRPKLFCPQGSLRPWLCSWGLIIYERPWPTGP